MTRGDIRMLVDAYGSAAARCRSAGLDAVEVQTATDYLLGSFLSPTLNRRTDEYGGSDENRLRIVREVLTTVREATDGELAVGVRTSTGHLIPGDQGYGAEQALAAMRALADEQLVDWVRLIAGSYWSFERLIPPMERPRAELAEIAGHFSSVVAVPIVLAGRIRTPSEAEALLAAGQADVIAMARSWIAEPEWMNKLERGEEQRIRPCLSCNQGCLEFALRGAPGTCVVNPRAGRELELARPRRARRAEPRTVVGGGPAGLESARLLAMAGHAVTLYEADSRLGGDLRIAGEAPGRGELLAIVEWWQRELELLEVELRLGERVGVEALAGLEHAIWAVGAVPAQTAVRRFRPQLDGIPGTDGIPHGREVLRGRRAVSGHALVIDEEGGWPAVSLVETLAADSDVATVTALTSAAGLGDPELAMTLELTSATRRLTRAGVRIEPRTFVERIEGRYAVLEGGHRRGPFDSIVLSMGTTPLAHPANVTAVGDCVAPRGWWAATNDAASLLPVS